MMDLRGFLIRKEGRRSECPSTLRREFLWASLLLPGEFIQHLPHHFCQQSRVWALVTRSSLLVYLLVNAFLVDTTHDAIEWEESRNQHWLLSPIVCWGVSSSSSLQSSFSLRLSPVFSLLVVDEKKDGLVPRMASKMLSNIRTLSLGDQAGRESKYVKVSEEQYGDCEAEEAIVNK
ncbi:hypothetical protein Tco_0276413 [Tanacetum coccineum]